MTEYQIKQKVKKQLEKEGYIYWFPLRNQYRKEDIFTIWDCLAWKDSDMRFIQFTSKQNISTREKKIKKFFEENQVFCPTEVWGWDKDKKKFIYRYI